MLTVGVYTFQGMHPMPWQAPPLPSSTALLMLPQGGFARAAWLEPPAPSPLKPQPLGRTSDISVGQSHGIVQTEAGYFAVGAQSGVTGPLFVPPDTHTVFVAGENDSIFAVTQAGTIFRAAGAKAAGTAGGFLPQGSLPGATRWDSSGTWIAAAKGDSVFISSDETKTFHASKPAPGKNIDQIFVRHDGIVAVITEAKPNPKEKKAGRGQTFLSRNEGKSWQPSAFQPAMLARHGAIIWNGHSGCPAALSLDGRQWSRVSGDLQDVIGRDVYADALFHSDYFLASAPPQYPSVVRPAAPPIPKPADVLKGPEKPCPSESVDILSSGHGFGLLGALAEMGPEHCAGADCLIGTAGGDTPQTKTRIEFFSDATCGESSVAPDGECRAGALLTRAPTMAIIDQTAGRVFSAALPPACDNPHRIVNIGGIGLVLCWAGGDRTGVFASDAHGVFAAEGTLPIAPDALTISMIFQDGTIVLQHDSLYDIWEQSNKNATQAPPVPLRGFVRAPLPLGDARAWREVRAVDGLLMRPYENGQVLVATTPSSARGRRLSLYLDRIGAPPLPIISNMDVTQNLLDLSIFGQYVRIQAHAALNRHALMKLPKGEREKQSPAWYTLGQDGRLIPETH